MDNSKSRSTLQKKQANRKQDEKRDHGDDDKHQQDQGEGQEQYSQSLDEFSSFIKRKTNDLVNIIATRYGLYLTY